MASSTDAWGIEIGANAIKAVRLQKVGDTVALTDFDVLPYKKVLTTPEFDGDEAIRMGLLELQARHSFENVPVVVSVPGHMAFARFAKLPPVEPKKIPDIVKFEAVQQIPFPIEEVEWDYQVFQQEDSPDVEVGIFAITKERVAKWLGNIHSVELPIHALSLSPVAIYNAMVFDKKMDESSPGTILMDVGTTASDVIIVEAGRIWLRTIPIGGHHFTDALLKSFKLSYSKVEKLKREVTSSKYARQIVQTMRPVFFDLANEVQRSLGYYTTMNRDAELNHMILMGQTAQLPGLRKLLEQQLNVDVKRLEDIQRISPPDAMADKFNDNLITLSPAYGLALQGLEEAPIECNVLPSKLIQDMVRAAKQPYFVIATIILVVAAALGYARVLFDQKAYDGNEKARSEVAQIEKKAKSLKSDLQRIETSDPRYRAENTRRVLDYRELKLVYQDIADALASAKPQPALFDFANENWLENVQKIPRGERRLIEITNVKVEMAPAESSGDQQLDPKEAPGGYVIRVSGTTPNSGGPKFIQETFFGALQKLEKQLAAEGQTLRPYRIQQVDMVSVGQTRRASATNPTTPKPTNPTPGSAAPKTGAGGKAIPGLKNIPGLKTPKTTPKNKTPEKNSDSTDDSQGRTVADFFPQKPLADEEGHNKDWDFEITWVMVLMDPSKTREIELSKTRSPAPESAKDGDTTKENKSP